MARPSSLVTLASGRLTPLSRLALALGLGLFVAVILLVRPVHEPGVRLVPERATILTLEHSSPWVDRAMLEEGAGLFMPVSLEGSRGSDASQPDASPFPAFGPELRHDPAQPLALETSEGVKGKWMTLEEAFPSAEGFPYLTLGQKPRRPDARVLTARTLQLSAYSDINENVFNRDFLSNDEYIKGHKLLFDKGIRLFGSIELRLGVDAMGLQSKPYLLRSSGSVEWDQALVEWAQALPWAIWLKPGSYRVVIGP